MASTRRLPNGTWQARFRDETGREHARHFSRKIDSTRWLAEQTASMVRGDYVDPAAGDITFRAWFDQWSARQVWALGTTVTAGQAAGSVTFEHVPMRTIRRSHVEQWVKTMSVRELAPSTIKMRFNYVHMAFRAAVRDRVIRHDPSEGVSLPKARRAEAAMTVPTPEEVGAALAACEGEPFRTFVAVCAFAGLRLGEAAGLQLGDIDFLRRTLTVRRQIQGQTNTTARPVPPKHGSERRLFLPEEMANLLAAHVRDLGVWGEERWLFGARGVFLHRNSAGHLWRQAREAAGLTKYTLHDLRHFYASGLIAAGCDVVTVQAALGHSDPTITLKVYAHLWPRAEDRTRAATADLMREATAEFMRSLGNS